MGGFKVGVRACVCVCVCVCVCTSIVLATVSGPQEYGWHSTDTSYTCMHTHNAMYAYSNDLMGQR